jgi:hypothetical protein
MQSIAVDMVPGGIPETIRISQYDKSMRKFAVRLLMDGVSYTIPGGYTATVSGTKPDGCGFSDACSVSGDTVTVTVSDQMSAVPGDIPCEITLFKEGEGRIASANFLLRVEKAALMSDDIISESSIPVFEKLVSVAAGSASAAKGSQTAATSSAAAAKTSEINAASSATAAKTSETSAVSSAGAAKMSEKNAAAFSSAASSKAQASSSSASAARTSETNAKTSETNAKKSADQAAQTASGLSSSLAQITQNKTDISSIKQSLDDLVIMRKFTSESVTATETATFSIPYTVPDGYKFLAVAAISSPEIPAIVYNLTIEDDSLACSCLTSGTGYFVADILFIRT